MPVSRVSAVSKTILCLLPLSGDWERPDWNRENAKVSENANPAGRGGASGPVCFAAHVPFAFSRVFAFSQFLPATVPKRSPFASRGGATGAPNAAPQRRSERCSGLPRISIQQPAQSIEGLGQLREGRDRGQAMGCLGAVSEQAERLDEVELGGEVVRGA